MPGVPIAGATFIQHPAIQQTLSTTPSVTKGRAVKSPGFASTFASGTGGTPGGIASPRLMFSPPDTVDVINRIVQSSFFIVRLLFRYALSCRLDVLLIRVDRERRCVAGLSRSRAVLKFVNRPEPVMRARQTRLVVFRVICKIL